MRLEQYLISSSIFADVSGGQDMTGYYPRETDRAGYHSLRDNDAIGASYDRYLRNGVQKQFQYCTAFFFFGQSTELLTCLLSV